MLSKRINNVIYGPEMELPIEKRGLGRMVFEKMKKYKDNVMQVNTHTKEEQTYDEINTKLIRIALEMRRQGIKPNDIILTCSNNNMDTILPVYSTLYLNAVTVTLDPSISLRDSKHLLKIVSPRMIFVHENAIELIEKAIESLESKPAIVVIGSHEKYATLGEFLKPSLDEATFVPDDVDDIHNVSNIFFSSGTTGLPKAVLHTHYSMLTTFLIIRSAFPNFGTALYYTSFYWISAFIITTTVIFSGGKRLYKDEFTPETFLKLVERYKVTLVFLSSTYATRFTEVNTRYAKIDSLQDFMFGGSGISEKYIRNLWKYFPNCGIRVGYGQSEVSGLVTLHWQATDHLFKAKPTSSGTILPNCILKIADLETGKTLGPMQKGEIRVKGPTIFRGYQALNGAAEEPFDEEGFVKTGDVGYVDEDNCLFFCDRIKEMFKYQGWHVAPASVESVIYQHPAVLETIVVGIPNDLDNNHPFALVVLKDGYDVSVEELLAFINGRLSEREKLRAGLRIVNKLLKTCTGKLARPLIRQTAIGGDLNQLID